MEKLTVDRRDHSVMTEMLEAERDALRRDRIRLIRELEMVTAALVDEIEQNEVLDRQHRYSRCQG